jgi:hypothetical protein
MLVAARTAASFMVMMGAMRMMMVVVRMMSGWVPRSLTRDPVVPRVKLIGSLLLLLFGPAHTGQQRNANLGNTLNLHPTFRWMLGRERFCFVDTCASKSQQCTFYPFLVIPDRSTLLRYAILYYEKLKVVNSSGWV